MSKQAAEYIFSKVKEHPGKSLLVTGGALLLGYFLIVRPIFKKLGIVKSDSQLEQERLAEVHVEQVGQEPSYPLIKYKELADTIEDALGSYIANDNEDVVYNVFNQLNNDRDMAELIRAFGMRSRSVALIGTGKKGLTAFINNAMNQNEISKVNNILQNKNIKYRL